MLKTKTILLLFTIKILDCRSLWNKKMEKDSEKKDGVAIQISQNEF